ncbi:MAG: toprim domain-containing protein [Candidatus Riflebacteria bacterium]|nr:toprim domain-containing protein [Candidatus Riflebacteria bacterium]
MNQKSFYDFGIQIPAGKSGEIKTICPQCSPGRKKKNYPCLNVNTEKGIWHCWHCEWSGSLKDGVYNKPEPVRKTPVYSKPKFTAQLNISDKWSSWLIKRGISFNTMKRNKIFSGPVYMPQIEGESDCIIFPYYRNGELINSKYRDIEKNFRMHSGAERILYGYDDISETVIWVEGEIDKLSMEEAGFKNCVSVPDGAPAPNTKDFSRKFTFLENAMEKLNSVKRHILAVDNDLPGKTLESELVRRLGPEKCFLVHFPSGCKDSNEVLLKYGKEELRSIIENCRSYPIEGVFAAEDCYEDVVNTYISGVQKGLSTGFENVDEFYSVRPGEWTVITGMPGSGKSEWLDQLTVNLALSSDWKIGVCSPENQPIKEHIIKLVEKLIGKPFGDGRRERLSIEELNSAIAWLNEHYFFILPERITLDNIMERAKSLIHSKGINGLIIDPWNEVEAVKPSNMNETEYISQCLAKIRRFARENMIHLWIVAHPVKLQKDQKSGKFPVPDLYDISGSAHWRNKADNGIVVHREFQATAVDIWIKKVRFKAVGKVGKASLNYDIPTGRYFIP